MAAIQEALEGQARFLAGSPVIEGILESIRQYEEMTFRPSQSLAEYFAGGGIRDIYEMIERQQDTADSLQRSIDSLGVHGVALEKSLSGYLQTQQAISDMTQPFDPRLMQGLLGEIGMEDQLGEFMRQFDLEALLSLSRTIPAAPPPDPEDKEEAGEDKVVLAPSVHIECLTAISEALVVFLSQHPEKMREMPPRKFEELVAELLSGLGFEVELTQQTRDGGRDIIAVRNDVFKTRHLVECKRYAEHRTVSVSEVRALYGVVTQERASQGIIVTTSRLSRDARLFVEDTRWQLDKAEFDELKRWILHYVKTQAARKLGPKE